MAFVQIAALLPRRTGYRLGVQALHTAGEDVLHLRFGGSIEQIFELELVDAFDPRGQRHRCMLEAMAGSDAFYDRDEWFKTYLRGRERPDNPNDAIERPIFDALAGDLRGLGIVDLGCGDARFGREALEQGADSYHGIESSRGMAAAARKNLAGTHGQITHGTIERWRPDPDEADLVTSRLALNHVEDLGAVFEQVRSALRPGGRMLLTVEHPIITSNHESLAGGKRTSWLVDDYFRTGARPHLWQGREVLKYHRTLDDYIDLVQESGLQLETLRESRPFRKNFQNEAEYERRLRIPLFLFIVAGKPHRSG